MQQVADDVGVVVVLRHTMIQAPSPGSRPPRRASGAGDMMRVMRFGTFVPQGWRIRPRRHRARPAVGHHAGAGETRGRQPDWESIWVYDHFHTDPGAVRGGDPRGVVADGRVRGRDVAASGSARCAPAWPTGTPPTSRRWRRPSTSSRVDASRWASAAAGTSTSGAPTDTGSRPRVSASAGCATVSRSSVRCGPRASRPTPGSTTPSTARSVSRGRSRARPCRGRPRTASRCGSPVAARRSR